MNNRWGQIVDRREETRVLMYPAVCTRQGVLGGLFAWFWEGVGHLLAPGPVCAWEATGGSGRGIWIWEDGM